MNFCSATFKIDIVHVRLHQLDAAPVFASGLRCQARNVSEVESLAMVRDDNRNFVAGPTTTTDVYFSFSGFLISMHDSVCQSFAERDFDAVFLTENALRPFDQKHQTIDQWRDGLNLAGHPGVDFQNGRTVEFLRGSWLNTACSTDDSHFGHGKRLATMGNAL
jgi:hypothetical protein